jgi:hypothetical protein
MPPQARMKAAMSNHARLHFFEIIIFYSTASPLAANGSAWRFLNRSKQ